MAWREERKKKWLSKIAASDGPKRQLKRPHIMKLSLKGNGMKGRVRPQSQEKPLMESEMSEDEQETEDTTKIIHDGQNQGDQSERRLSEGEIFVPKKRPRRKRKEVTQNSEQPNAVKETKMDLSEGETVVIDDQKVESKSVTKNNKICRKWLNGKCPRGKRCHYLHKKETTTPKEIVEEKPKSFYAAVCLILIMLSSSYFKVKWKERISYFYKHYCISESMAYLMGNRYHSIYHSRLQY